MEKEYKIVNFDFYIYASICIIYVYIYSYPRYIGFANLLEFGLATMGL